MKENVQKIIDYLLDRNLDFKIINIPSIKANYDILILLDKYPIKIHITGEIITYKSVGFTSSGIDLTEDIIEWLKMLR